MTLIHTSCRCKVLEGFIKTVKEEDYFKLVSRRNTSHLQIQFFPRVWIQDLELFLERGSLLVMLWVIVDH